MPKVYTSAADRQEAKIIRELSGMAKGRQSELADLWGMTQQGVSYKLSKGNVTLFDVWKARDIFDAAEITELIGGKRGYR